jgi:small subunit ribosomal protein S5
MWISSRGFRGRRSVKESDRVLGVRRVTKVVKGGKKLSFSAVVVVGNENGKVGVGVGKARDTSGAIKKGRFEAHKNMIDVHLTSYKSISHETRGRFGAADVMLKPSSPGSGVIAGGPIRAVVELAGIKNILSKQFGSSNLLNNARATINGLELVESYSDYKRKFRV